LYGGTARRGVIFSVTTSGTEKALYSVKRAPDGAFPEASLIDVKDILYSTTRAGGTYYYSYYSDAGTAFSITTDGTENVIHSFGSDSDGKSPLASLIASRARRRGERAASRRDASIT
jgi:hypothetical protein